MENNNLILSDERPTLWLNFLRDDSLTYKELGILGLLISAPKNQFVSEKWLANQKATGLTSVRSGVRELERKGFLERKPIRSLSGHFKGNTWTVKIPKK